MRPPPLTGFPEAKKTLESPPGKYQGASTTPFFCDTHIRPENTEGIEKKIRSMALRGVLAGDYSFRLGVIGVTRQRLPLTFGLPYALLVMAQQVIPIDSVRYAIANVTLRVQP
jgi:hypothetical protein